MGKTILVVDDAPSVRQAVGFTLQEEGYDVVEAEDGVDALKKLNGLQVDMIVCDINMPKMDGITFIKKLTTDEAYASYKYTPLIMLTTESGENRKIEGKKAGAKAWIVKPFKHEQLIEAVRKLML